MRKTPALFDPFREIVSLRDNMERMFDAMLGRYPAEKVEAIWAPAVDIEETNDAVIVRAELPGMKREDIQVSTLGDTVTISGERKHESESKNRSFHRIERAYGRFVRTIQLPVEIEPDKASATYKAGILELTLPKSQKAKAREIEIKVGD